VYSGYDNETVVGSRATAKGAIDKPTVRFADGVLIVESLRQIPDAIYSFCKSALHFFQLG